MNTMKSLLGFNHIRIIFCISISLSILGTHAHAKLQIYNFDWYIRHADLIVEGKIISKDTKGDLTIFHAEVLRTHLGANKKTIDIAEEYIMENDDAPHFKIGNESIMLLEHGDGHIKAIMYV
jgi:hypothetical protein